MIKNTVLLLIIVFCFMSNSSIRAQSNLSEEDIKGILYAGCHPALGNRSSDSVYTLFSKYDKEVLCYMDSVLHLESDVSKEILQSVSCSLILVSDYDVPGIFASRYPGVFVNHAKELLSFGENKFDTKLCISFFPYPGVKAHEIGERTYYYRCFDKLKETPDTTFILDCFQTDYLKDFILDSCSSEDINSFNDQSDVATYLRNNTYDKEQICTVSIKDLNPELIENIFLFTLGVRQFRFYSGGKDLNVYLFLDTKQSTNYKFSVYLLD